MSERTSVFLVFCTLNSHHLPCKYFNKHFFHFIKKPQLDVCHSFVKHFVLSVLERSNLNKLIIAYKINATLIC